jgi:Na+/glutamate symporter
VVSFLAIVVVVVIFFTTIGILSTYNEYKKQKLFRGKKYAFSTFLIKGLNNIAVGLALFIGLYSLGKGPWLLGGLIPLFVGNMYMIFYLLGKES